MFNNLRIQSKLFLLTLTMVLCLMVVGIVGLFNINKLNENVEFTLNSADQSQGAINIARNAQVHFKIQVQEWKNILLRGNDEDAFNKYLDGFTVEEKIVQEELAKLKTLMQKQGLPTDNVDRTITIHADLGTQYRAALKNYDFNNPQSYQIVDGFVKGIDRAPTQAIDDIVKEIDNYSTKAAAESKAHSIEEYKNARALLMIIAIASAAFAFILALIISRQIIKPINTMKHEFDELAENGGDLTQQIHIKVNDELGELAQAFNRFITNLRAIMIDVNKSSNEVEETAQQLTANSQQTATGANENAAAMGEIATTVDQVSTNIQEIANAAQLAEGHAVNGADQLIDIKEQFKKNNEIAMEVAGTVHSLDGKSQEISQIVNMITQIAEQTNLLALNAAIEAARAGEHGRGFAVVAEEVRKLAEESAQATKKIGDIINGIQGETHKAVEQMNIAGTVVEGINTSIVDLGVVFDEIEGAVKGLASQIQDIASASEQMSAGVQNVAATTEQQTASMQEVSAFAESLANVSAELKALIGRFKI